MQHGLRSAAAELGEVRAIPLRGIPDIRVGDSIPLVILNALAQQKLKMNSGDILVIKHKIIAKAENCRVALDSVRPLRKAIQFSRRNHTDARVAELAIREAKRIVRDKHVLITETQHGFVCANSGVDVSNVDGGVTAVLLPKDPDKSARTIHRELKRITGLHIPVIISDSFGRAWREGLIETAIGVAGMMPILDYRGKRDAYGYKMHATEEAVADELACVAGLICGKDSRVPACIIRGYKYRRGAGNARQLVRPTERDLFR